MPGLQIFNIYIYGSVLVNEMPKNARYQIVNDYTETQDFLHRKIIWPGTATINRSSEEYFAEIS